MGPWRWGGGDYMWPWTTKPVIRVIFLNLDWISWINKLSFDDDLLGSDNIWLRYNYLKINLRVRKNLNIEKIAFKVVQMKFLAMHITNQKLSFDMWPWTTKPVISSTGIFAAIATVWVKIIDFSFMPKIIRILSKDHVPLIYFVNFLP